MFGRHHETASHRHEIPVQPLCRAHDVQRPFDASDAARGLHMVSINVVCSRTTGEHDEAERESVHGGGYHSGRLAEFPATTIAFREGSVHTAIPTGAVGPRTTVHRVQGMPCGVGFVVLGVRAPCGESSNGGGMTIASAPACPPVAEIRQAYAAAIGERSLVDLHLADRYAVHRSEAWLSRDRLVLVQRLNGHREIWSDTRTEATHLLPNGFLGRGAAWRVAARYAAVRALSGELADTEPTSAVCLRHHGVKRPALRYRIRDVSVQITLHPSTYLPDEIRAVPESHPTAGTQLNDIRYRRFGGSAVPVAWRNGISGVSFEIVEAASANDPAPVGTSVPAVNRAVVIPTVPGLHDNETAIRVTIGRHRFRFYVDSGDSITALSPKTAAVIGLRAAAADKMLQVTGAVDAQPAIVRRVRVGSIWLENEPVYVIRQTFGYDGIIGSSLFARGQVRLTPRSVIVLPGHLASSAGIPIDTYDGVPFAVARVRNRRADVLLDSGAAFEGLLPQRLVQTAPSGRGKERCRIYGIPLWLILGYVDVPDLRLGAARWPTHACVSYDDRAARFIDGIIGQRAIVRAGVTFDYRASRIELGRMPSRTPVQLRPAAPLK